MEVSARLLEGGEGAKTGDGWWWRLPAGRLAGEDERRGERKKWRGKTTSGWRQRVFQIYFLIILFISVLKYYWGAYKTLLIC